MTAPSPSPAAAPCRTRRIPDGRRMDFAGDVRMERSTSLLFRFLTANMDFWVPKAIAQVRDRPADEATSSAPQVLTVPMWWVRKNPYLLRVVAKRYAGLPARTPGPPFTLVPRGQGRLAPTNPEGDALTTPATDFAYVKSTTYTGLAEVMALFGIVESEALGLHFGTLEFSKLEMWGRAMDAMEAEAQRIAVVAASL